MGEEDKTRPDVPASAGSEERGTWLDDAVSPNTQQMRTIGQRRREAERKLDQHLEEAKHKAEAAEVDNQKTES
ncbi:hypothetical protein AB0N65_17040 [Paenarthrobacter sp. NPDC089322]|uniref:hypothetical protein n=1 Tax=Paenarthrobacter sp. NPDC089322 TaxID=3155065 RepID=UPI003422EA7D